MDSRLAITMFGIEFETCVCNRDDGKLNSDEDFVTMLKKINKSVAVFRFQEDPREDIDYTKWSVTVDRSVRCRQPSGTYFTQGKRTPDRCNQINVPLELVTPIYNYKRDYEIFTGILKDVIFSDEFVYESNDTQGMHINVSYLGRDYDPLKVLEMWWYFEPVILKFVPVNRRYSPYAEHLRKIFNTIDALRHDSQSFFENPDSPPAKYTALCKKSNRFEFRLVHAEMTPDHILSWLGFCTRFIVASVDFVFPSDRNTGTFDELFSIIGNDNIKRYFSEFYYKVSPFGSDYVERFKSINQEQKRKFLDQCLDDQNCIDEVAKYVINKNEESGLYGDDKILLEFCYENIFAISKESDMVAINMIVESLA